MSERIPCNNSGCGNTILPATAAANNGLCAPCIGAIRTKEREEYIRLNRRTVNPYEGISDRVDMAIAMLSPRKYDPLIVYIPAPQTLEQLFASLTEEEVHRLAAIGGKLLAGGNVDLAEDVGKSLATLTDCDLTEMLRAWVAQNHHWPAIVFRGAKTEIRDAIIWSLVNGHAKADHALCALAWIGDDVVRKAFVEWDLQKPGWVSELYLSPLSYADTAGWEIVGGTRRNLFHEECYALTQVDEDDATAFVTTFEPTGKACPWCGHELSNMLEIDLTTPVFGFLGLSGVRLPILTCHGCTCYGGPFYSKVEHDGTANPHQLGVRPDWLPTHEEAWGEPAWRDIPVNLTPRRSFHAADWCMELKTSQIGGLPSWVQDASYPKCPDCCCTMNFIAQLNEGDFPRHEGTYYAFLCISCRTTATIYQQT